MNDAWEKAEGQLWLITAAQLAELEFRRGAVAARRRNRRLWSVYPGVYAVGHPGMTPDRERMAAVLACGEGAAISHLSAAVHWEIWEGADPDRHHVSIPTRSGRRGAMKLDDDGDLSDRIHIHRPRALETTTHRVVPVTSLSQTFIDLASVLPPGALRPVLRQAERVHRFDLRALLERANAASPTAWRQARLRRALATVVGDRRLTDSEREELYLGICRRYRLLIPDAQVWITPRRRVDFCWPELRLIVEIDDRGSHDGYVAFVDDRRRDRELLELGFEVVRFTVVECRHDEAIVARDTRNAVARRARLFGIPIDTV